jgi:hypothetical protein
MILESVDDPKFLSTIEGWLNREREVLVLVEYPRAAGAKSFEFFSSNSDLAERVRELSPKTRLTAYQNQPLPIRGRVDEVFISKCLREIDDGWEYLLVGLAPRSAGGQRWFHHEAGTTHQELKDALIRLRGDFVAVGRYPHSDPHGVESITAFVPDDSANARPGA